MTLTAPGAKAPVVSAENMRLDVKLLPLLSHQLFVKQVMLKNAVIRLTPDSEEHSQMDAPIAPAGTGTDAADAAWKFDIDNLRVVDSLLIWQRADNEQINVRDINLTLQQTQTRQAQLELSSRVNRDQRDLTFSMAADVDLQQFPRQIGAKVTQFNYQLAGADIPNGGIQGEGNAQVVYQQTPAQIAVSQLSVSANNSQLTGDISATLGAVLGVASAYFGGRIDLYLQRVMDIFLSFPLIILALALVAILGNSIHNLIAAIMIPMIPRCALVIRSSALAIREMPYVDAARAAGFGHGRIILRHMLPNVMAPYLVMLTAFLGQAILLEASLSFLGLGVQPPNPEWGLMVAEARDFFLRDWRLMTYPGLAVVITGVPPTRPASSDTPSRSTNGPVGVRDCPTKTLYPESEPWQQFPADAKR